MATARMVASRDTMKTMIFRPRNVMWNDNGFLGGDMGASPSWDDASSVLRILRGARTVALATSGYGEAV